MLRTALLAAVALALAGCATHREFHAKSNIGHYRPKGVDQLWEIQFVSTTTKDQGWTVAQEKASIDLIINGDIVDIPGSSTSWHSTYQNFKIAGNCHSLRPRVDQCNLYIDGEEAGVYNIAY